MNILEKIQEYLKDKNTNGIYVPMIRDPKTGSGSVSLTLVFISFNVNILGLIGRATKFLDGVSLEGANTLFLICVSLYFGRKLQTKVGTIESSDKPQETK